jgi:hypothetical protein
MAQFMAVQPLSHQTRIRIYDSEERFLGLVDVTSDGVVKVHRLFVTTP